jgi:hypothetical protein
MIIVTRKHPRAVIEKNFVYADFEDRSSAGISVGVSADRRAGSMIFSRAISG